MEQGRIHPVVLCGGAGTRPLHFVEVQTGAYLEEDDIIRIDDDDGR